MAFGVGNEKPFFCVENERIEELKNLVKRVVRASIWKLLFSDASQQESYGHLIFSQPSLSRKLYQKDLG